MGYESKRDKILLIKEYLNMIKPYLVDIINNHKIKEWKIQLSMTINFISSKDSDEIPTMHTRSNNIKIMMVNKTD